MRKFSAAVFVFSVLLYMQFKPPRVEARLEEDLPVERVDIEEQKNEMMDVLHNVLEKLKKNQSVLERKFRRLPGVCSRLRRRIKTILCNVGNFCSVKKGARHGQICKCPRGSKCNYFFLKCT
uniref:Si:ch211-191i18.4 n=1 Tax=Paramormyrops kingsleyae TaxID=1676925 RepID=A0A3B3QV79_9TELE